MWRALSTSLLLLAGTLGACSRPEIVAPGHPAPDYAARDLAGSVVRLADLRGEVVVLNVWATWCWPCRREMPALDELQRELGDAGLRVVAVSVDAGDATPAIREFLDELGLSIQVLHDATRTVERRFMTRGVPETFLIGADGTLLRHWIGRIDPGSPAIRAPVHDALRVAHAAARTRGG